MSQCSCARLPSSPESSLSESTRQRIRGALSVLQSQRFFYRAGDVQAHEETTADVRAPHRFVFNSCTRASGAFQERVPEKIELIKAIATAELEIENQYHESEHDALFRGFDETSLTQEDLAFFPSYLICMRVEDCQGREKAKLIDTLSSGLPMKALVTIGDPVTHRRQQPWRHDSRRNCGRSASAPLRQDSRHRKQAAAPSAPAGAAVAGVRRHRQA